MPVYIGGNKYLLKYLGRQKFTSRVNGELKEIRITRYDGLEETQSVFHELFHAICYEHPANPRLKELYDDEESIEILTKELVGSLRQLGIVK